MPRVTGVLYFPSPPHLSHCPFDMYREPLQSGHETNFDLAIALPPGMLPASEDGAVTDDIGFSRPAIGLSLLSIRTGAVSSHSDNCL